MPRFEQLRPNSDHQDRILRKWEAAGYRGIHFDKMGNIFGQAEDHSLWTGGRDGQYATCVAGPPTVSFRSADSAAEQERKYILKQDRKKVW